MARGLPVWWALIASWYAVDLFSAEPDWPGFRGPNGSGIGLTSGLPVRFGPAENLVWRTALPTGKSSPVLAADRIFLTGAAENNLWTLCLDRVSGRILWGRAIPQPRAEKLHQLNHAAAPTPVTDGVNVYAFFADFGLVAYGADGQERWRKQLGPFNNLHGMASSPVLVDDRLVLAIDQDENSYLLAVDKRTGRTLWRSARPEAVHGFATPVVFRPDGDAAQLVVPGSYELTAYSAATGEKLWWVRGLTWQVKASAVVEDGVVYATGWAPGADPGPRQLLPPFADVAREADETGTASSPPGSCLPGGSTPEAGRPSISTATVFSTRATGASTAARRASHNVTMAIRPGRVRGDLTDSHLLWTNDRAVPEVPSPLLWKGVLYTIKDGGILTSFDAGTGRILKQARMPGAVDKFYASPVLGDDKLYLASESGKVSVVQAGAVWESLAVNELDEPCYATPALSGGRLYLRTSAALYCFARK